MREGRAGQDVHGSGAVHRYDLQWPKIDPFGGENGSATAEKWQCHTAFSKYPCDAIGVCWVPIFRSSSDNAYMGMI